jgi:hypothetical protein
MMTPQANVFAGLVDARSPLWQEALGRVEFDFYHLPAYAELCAKRDAGLGRAYVELDHDFAMLVPMTLMPLDPFGLGGHFHAQSPYGYPGPAVSKEAGPERLRQAFSQMASELRRLNVVTFFSRMHPLLPFPVNDLEPLATLVTHGRTVSIDLAAPLDESWAKIRETHRRHISRARGAGYTASFSWDGLDGYQAAYDETMRRVGAPSQYAFGLDYVAELRQALGSCLHLITIVEGGRVACGGLFVETGGILQYHLGGTRDAYLGGSPMKVLFDEVRRWGHGRGYQVLHLGGGVGAREDSLFEFKAGFPERRHTFRTLRMVTDEPTYSKFCEACGQSPERAAYFPAYALSPSPKAAAKADPIYDSRRRARVRFRALASIEF